jgi:hypothetical protein
VGTIWGLVSFYFGIVVGISLPGEEKPPLYAVFHYIFDGVPLLAVAWLCFRNWRFPRLASDRNIWLLFSLRSLFYLAANLLFGYWESVLQRSPEVTLADPVYIVSYLLLLWALYLAIRARRMILKAWQYSAIGAIAILGIWLGYLSAFPPEAQQARLVSPPSVAEPTVIASNAIVTVAQDNSADSIAHKEAPGWVLAVEETLKPYSETISLFYIVLDIILLVLAGTLALTFWGGRFSRTWLAIALGALLLYIADVRYAYIVARGNFETGSLLDLFWTFSPILFGIGAAFEYDTSISLRSRRR